MSDEAPDTPSSAGRSSQRTFVLAACVVAILVVLTAVLVISSRSGSAPVTASKTSAAAASSAAATATREGSCGPSASDAAVPLSPPSARWELVGSVAAPSSSSVGPARVSDGLRSCYAQTATGALFAAVNFVAATSDPQVRVAAVRTLTAPGAGRDRALTRVGQQPQTSSGNRVQVAGYTFLNFGQDSTQGTVDLAFRATRSSDGTFGLVHLPLTMQWRGGDWRVVLPSTGELFPGIGPIPNLTGYVPWGAA